MKHSQWKFVFLFLAASQARACHIYVHFTPCSRQRAIMFHPRDGGPVRKSQICDKDDGEWLLSLMMKTFITLALMTLVTEEVGRRRSRWRRGWCWCWWRRWWCLRLCPDVPTLLQSHFCHADNFGQEPLSLSCGYTHTARVKKLSCIIVTIINLITTTIATTAVMGIHTQALAIKLSCILFTNLFLLPEETQILKMIKRWKNHSLLATPVEDPPSLIGVQAKQIESLHTEANTDLYFGSTWISRYRYKYKKNE